MESGITMCAFPDAITGATKDLRIRIPVDKVLLCTTCMDYYSKSHGPSCPTCTD